MSNNFYIQGLHASKDGEIEDLEGLHIGKDDARDYFCLRLYPHLGLNCLEDWINFCEGKTIIAEAGYTLTLNELLGRVRRRAGSVNTSHVFDRSFTKGYAYKGSFYLTLDRWFN